ncbi:hypothetical protein HA402_012840 [Bradysia odoriphaga]|nr:hypothetical protein HA402_012840 [Bradysia odoriphaga]
MDTTVGPLYFFNRHHHRKPITTTTASPWDVTTTDYYPHDESTEHIYVYSDVEMLAEEIGLPLWVKFAIFIVVCVVILGTGFFFIRRYCLKRRNENSHGEVKPTSLLE